MTKLRKAIVLAMAFAVISGSALASDLVLIEQPVVEENQTVTEDTETEVKDDTSSEETETQVEDQTATEDDKEEVKDARIAGTDRVLTALEVSKAMFAEGQTSDYAILVSGANTADALAAGPLAIEHKAPILLATDKKELGEEIARLKVKNLIIIGGENSVAKSFETAFEGVEVTRLAGANRYETSVKVAEDLVAKFDYDKATLANGINSVDALTAANLAQENSSALLLTPAEDLTDEVKAFIAKEEIKSLSVVGGENSVNEKALEAAGDKYETSSRIAGANRYETAIKLAEALDKDPSKVVVVSGENAKLVDALAAAPFAADMDATIVLTSQDKLPAETAAYLEKDSLDAFRVIGGENTVSKTVYDEIKALLAKEVEAPATDDTETEKPATDDTETETPATDDTETEKPVTETPEVTE